MHQLASRRLEWAGKCTAGTVARGSPPSLLPPMSAGRHPTHTAHFAPHCARSAAV